MKTYELIIDDPDHSGVEAISLVEMPAIEYNFIALSKQVDFVEVKAMNEERKMVYGLALVPDKPILRRDKNGNEFNIVFSKDTVREAARLYLKQSKTNNATIEHDKMTTGVHMAESWIVENPELDKIKHFGIDAPEGSWAVGMKVTDDEVWQEIKAGKVLGFSIEGIFKKTVEMDAQELIEEIKRIITHAESGTV